MLIRHTQSTRVSSNNDQYRYRGPSIDASYQISVQLGKWFKRRISFRNQPIKNKNDMWWPYLLTGRDEMSIIYRGPSIEASYQVSVHLAKRFQRRIFFFNRQINNKNCLWRPCLSMDRDKISNLYKEPSITSFYQISFYLAEGFQRRRLKCEKLMDNK
jgi:hypothetical protein